MSTHCFISKQLEDGRIEGIYCHFDGYEAHAGKILREHYADPVKVEALLALGDISVLAPEVGEKHDFNNPTKGWTIAYHRDRGERRRPLKSYTSPSSALEDYSFVYVFTVAGWYSARR